MQEIYHMLMDREDTCHRTCFSLQLNCQTLDNFTELSAIEGLKDGAVLKVVEGVQFTQSIQVLHHSLVVIRQLQAICLVIVFRCFVLYAYCVKFTEPYTAREARLHVRHIRDLLKSVDQRDAYDGIDCASLSFLSTLAGNVLGTIA